MLLPIPGLDFPPCRRVFLMSHFVLVDRMPEYTVNAQQFFALVERINPRSSDAAGELSDTRELVHIASDARLISRSERRALLELILARQSHHH